MDTIARRSAAPAPGQLRLPPPDCIYCGERWVPVELDGQIISLECPVCEGTTDLPQPIPRETWEAHANRPYRPTSREIREVMAEDARRGDRSGGSRSSGRRRKQPKPRRPQLPLDYDPRSDR